MADCSTCLVGVLSRWGFWRAVYGRAPEAWLWAWGGRGWPWVALASSRCGSVKRMGVIGLNQVVVEGRLGRYTITTCDYVPPPPPSVPSSPP